MSVIINDDKLWPLFVGMVCDALDKAGYTGDKYEFAISLDMSFDEIIENKIPLMSWKDKIELDLFDYKSREGKEYFK